MSKSSIQPETDADDATALTIPPDNVCWIIIKSGECDVKDARRRGPAIAPAGP